MMRVEGRSEDSGGSKSGSVHAIVVLTSILDVLGSFPRPMTAADVAEHLGMTRSRAWRYLGTLRQLDLVYQLPNEDRYRLGWKLHKLGLMASRRHPSAALASDHLARLHRETRLSASYLLLAGEELVVLQNLTDLAQPSVAVPISNTVPLLNSASGRVLLAFNDGAKAETLIAAALRRGEPAPFGGSPERLLNRLELIRRRGFEVAAVAGLNINAIAAPVFETPEASVAALSLLGTRDLVSDEGAPELVAQLTEAAKELSRACATLPPP